MAHAAFKAVGAEQPSAWKVRFLRRSVRFQSGIRTYAAAAFGLADGSASRTCPEKRRAAAPGRGTAAARLLRSPNQAGFGLLAARERALTFCHVPDLGRVHLLELAFGPLEVAPADLEPGRTTRVLRADAEVVQEEPGQVKREWLGAGAADGSGTRPPSCLRGSWMPRRRGSRSALLPPGFVRLFDWVVNARRSP